VANSGQRITSRQIQIWATSEPETAKTGKVINLGCTRDELERYQHQMSDTRLVPSKRLADKWSSSKHK
jgi:hypothetical protein